MEPKQRRLFPVLSILLSIAAVASVAAFLLYRLMNNRSYQQKWSDYEDCGVV